MSYPGIQTEGKSLGDNEGGLLVLTQPWPHMLRTLYGDHQRFLDVYFSKIEGRYFAGDGARRDEDGYYWVMGRVDDVLNVSGHRLSTMEVERCSGCSRSSRRSRCRRFESEGGEASAAS